VDAAQVSIRSNIEIYVQIKAALNPVDSPMSVHEALIEINVALDEHLSLDEGAFKADTRFALTFFERFGYSERP
jgi:putative DNA methylase